MPVKGETIKFAYGKVPARRAAGGAGSEEPELEVLAS